MKRVALAAIAATLLIVTGTDAWALPTFDPASVHAHRRSEARDLF
jgi:hypothetical protein